MFGVSNCGKFAEKVTRLCQPFLLTNSFFANNNAADWCWYSMLVLVLILALQCLVIVRYFSGQSLVLAWYFYAECLVLVRYFYAQCLVLVWYFYVHCAVFSASGIRGARSQIWAQSTWQIWIMRSNVQVNNGYRSWNYHHSHNIEMCRWMMDIIDVGNYHHSHSIKCTGE